MLCYFNAEMLCSLIYPGLYICKCFNHYHRITKAFACLCSLPQCDIISGWHHIEVKITEVKNMHMLGNTKVKNICIHSMLKFEPSHPQPHWWNLLGQEQLTSWGVILCFPTYVGVEHSTMRVVTYSSQLMQFEHSCYLHTNMPNWWIFRCIIFIPTVIIHEVIGDISWQPFYAQYISYHMYWAQMVVKNI